MSSTTATSENDFDPEDKLYTTGKVAEIFGVRPSTVRRWIAEGKMHAIRMPGEKGKGQYRVRKSEVKRFGHHVYEERR